MIITSTPLRMSFVGGGSDLPAYYEKFGGAVVSTSIDKYVYVTINHKFDESIRVSYSRTENVSSVQEISHDLVREALQLLKINGGLEIVTMADIPSQGTGLGSSSSFTVGLLHALHAYKSEYVSAAQLGRESCHIEIDICGAPIGKQDQYAAAFGGFNLIKFNRDGEVEVSPIVCAPEMLHNLQDNLLLLYTGRTRSANLILSAQSRQCGFSKDTQATMHKMVQQTADFVAAMQGDDCDAIGKILHEAWCLKRSLLSGISDDAIDAWYAKGLAAGATGGKLLGAGAGGFMLFYAPRDRHEAIIHAMPELRPVAFRFESAGSKIIFYQR